MIHTGFKNLHIRSIGNLMIGTCLYKQVMHKNIAKIL